jgi:hypothetical protein
MQLLLSNMIYSLIQQLTSSFLLYSMKDYAYQEKCALNYEYINLP